MSPWDHWYHLTAHTYGSWLRGDPRGWRSRHHREHVDGDYKHPPPEGRYDAQFARSKELMKRDPVKIHHDLRTFVLDKIIERLHQFAIQVTIASQDGVHF